MLPELCEQYYKEWEGWIVNQARRLAREDLDFANDLAQEGFWKLLELDLERVQSNKVAYIRRVLWDHMLMVLRGERRAKIIGGTKPRSRCRPLQTPRRRKIAGRKRRRLEIRPYHCDAAPLDEETIWELWVDM